ncbi:hypothetical protein C4D60_Mb07t19340 [Musa balbisiana]|uniref:Uncharacterized protein n=1 Tax=Musa balbisiana TaxID=52838 RepID=A0A4S8JGF3_MUSBA|nr:hypothetical protein C4D60_Mb07t19340 [Musa balbisiana]
MCRSHFLWRPGYEVIIEKMSVVGFDVGNESCIVAVARQRGIDVVLNDESKRETPAVVCFGEKQRFIGTAGAASSVMNPKNTVSQIKRLVGRKFSDPELQRDIQSLPFKVTEGRDGFPLIHANYVGDQRAFTPTQILAMVLSNLKSIAETNLHAAVVDCCIGIPVYFTDLQRRAVLDAATIAGLHPLRLLHETTATALAYGIYKTDLPESDQLNVAFVDVGHASMQVCIAGFKKGKLKILAHSYDRSLGGRDFDEVLFKHFAAKFKYEYKIDVYQNARACLRLRAACEKLKKVLSANPEAPLNIECLMEEKDVRGFIKREEFEHISAPILERVKGPLEKALAEAGLSVENIYSVEVVGSGSRVPAIIRILTEFFGKEPRRTMNASECVARGCALQCAILSPTFKVREFQVHESFPFSIALSWKGSAPDSQTVGSENQQSSVVFPKGNPIPSVKALAFYRSSTFTVDVVYADVGDLQVPVEISTYTIGPFQTSKGERAKLKVKVRLNLHGIVSIESATFPFSIALSWKGSAPDSQTVGSENQQSSVVFPKGNPIPSVKALAFYRSSTFTVDVVYADVGDLQVPVEISTYTIGPFQTSKGERAKLKVKVRLNLHGIVSIESATMLEEEEVEVAVSSTSEVTKESMDMDEATKFSSKTENDENAPSKTENDVVMQEAKGTTDNSSAGFENGAPEAGEKPVQMDTDSKVEVSKKKVKKTNVPVTELVYGGMLAEELQKAVEKEFEMALQDRVMEETKDKKNAVEAYVYDMRNKLYDKYQDFVTPTEKEALIMKLQEVEDWLYEDGEDETKGVYVAKLEELKKTGDPVEERYKEWTERGPAIDQLAYCINSFREAALSNDPKFDHIDLAEKQKVINECGEAEAWLREKKQQQDALPKYAIRFFFLRI